MAPFGPSLDAASPLSVVEAPDVSTTVIDVISADTEGTGADSALGLGACVVTVGVAAPAGAGAALIPAA